MTNPGVVDEKGVLWPSTSVGKFCQPAAGNETIWGCFSNAAKKYTGLLCVGERAVTYQEKVKGFDKFVMGAYSFMTCAPTHRLSPRSAASLQSSSPDPDYSAFP